MRPRDPHRELIVLTVIHAALQSLDLEGDWDPEAHDRQMAELYANDAAEFGEDDVVDDEKPTWDDDIDVADIVPPEALEDGDDGDGPLKKKKKKKKKKSEEDADEGGVDINEMDADVERLPGDDEDWDGTEEMRKRKLEEYMDEVYGLDFNDMVRPRCPPLPTTQADRFGARRLEGCRRGSATRRSSRRRSG